MTIKIKNLTPHPVTINGITYSPEGIIPRISEIREEPIRMTGLTLERIFVGDIQGLPDPDGSFLIVSREVAQKAHRPDVVCPCDYIRDADGHIIGAKSVAWFPPSDISPDELLKEENVN